MERVAAVGFPEERESFMRREDFVEQQHLPKKEGFNLWYVISADAQRCVAENRDWGDIEEI